MNGAPALPLLLVEDDADMAANIADYLGRRGWTVHHAATGALALHLVLGQSFAAVVLDRGLPGLDGIEVCQRLRHGLDRKVPVLMLTAADRLEDRLSGFAAGVDDYLVKPFALPELQARLTALVRRAQGAAPSSAGEVLRCADLVLSPGTREVSRAGRPLVLTNMGFALLELLLRRSPEVVRRDELEQALWHDEPPGSDALRSHWFALRNAVDTPPAPPLLHTHRGVGFQVRPPPANDPVRTP
jgi:DNA-binding response OmpR family regulator